MIKKARTLVPRSIKSRLKTLLECIQYAPVIARLLLRRKKQFAVNLVSRNRRVTFISDAPLWREMKLASGLKRAGWEVTLLYGKQALSLNLEPFYDARQFQSPWEAIELAHQAGTRVFHNFSHFGNQMSARLMQNKPGRVIFDFYDYVFSMVDGTPDLEVRRQHVADQFFCIENADAICCRDMQLQYRRKETRLGRGKPLLLFPEYCWNDGPLPERRRDREVHIAQVGWMGLETLGQIDVGAFQIFEIFVMAGCHLHIYLHPIYPLIGSAAFEVAFSDYLELGRKTGRVHIHPTVSPEKLITALGNYDFGAGVSNGLSFDLPWAGHNPARFPFCGSSRTFDYLDAGLGLILHKQLSFMYRTFRRAGIVCDTTQLLAEADLKTALAHRPGVDVFQQARTELSIDRNIGRLTQFYENLA